MCRYFLALLITTFKPDILRRLDLLEVGRCKLNAVDPYLGSDCFQVISYQTISWFQSLPFKFNLRHYIEESGGMDRTWRRAYSKAGLYKV